VFSRVSEESCNLFSNIPDISENVSYSRVALIFNNGFISLKHKTKTRRFKMNSKVNADSTASKFSNRIWSAYNTVCLYSFCLDAFMACWIMDKFGGVHSSESGTNNN
jgi:hypothetical protein